MKNAFSKVSEITRHTAHGTRHTAHGTRHTAHGTRHTAHGTRHTAEGVRRTQSDVIHQLDLGPKYNKKNGNETKQPETNN